MALKLVPYSNVMLLGQGFNSYTQQICIDDAVVIDDQRAENVITKDGTTMRILADKNAQPSVWNRQPEVVNDDRAESALQKDRALHAAAGAEGRIEEKHDYTVELELDKDATAHEESEHEGTDSEASAVEREHSESGAGEHIMHEEAHDHEDTFHHIQQIPGGFATPKQRPEPTQIAPKATTISGTATSEHDAKKSMTANLGSPLTEK
ncbi:hypothetical protein PMIN07_006586 [Paraphaeosphaeria minitans]